MIPIKPKINQTVETSAIQDKIIPEKKINILEMDAPKTKEEIAEDVPSKTDHKWLIIIFAVIIVVLIIVIVYYVLKYNDVSQQLQLLLQQSQKTQQTVAKLNEMSAPIAAQAISQSSNTQKPPQREQETAQVAVITITQPTADELDSVLEKIDKPTTSKITEIIEENDDEQLSTELDKLIMEEDE